MAISIYETKAIIVNSIIYSVFIDGKSHIADKVAVMLRGVESEAIGKQCDSGAAVTCAGIMQIQRQNCLFAAGDSICRKIYILAVEVVIPGVPQQARYACTLAVEKIAVQ